MKPIKDVRLTYLIVFILRLAWGVRGTELIFVVRQRGFRDEDVRTGGVGRPASLTYGHETRSFHDVQRRLLLLPSMSEVARTA